MNGEPSIGVVFFSVFFGMFESMVSAIVLVCNITREGVGLVRLHHNNHW